MRALLSWDVAVHFAHQLDQAAERRVIRTVVTRIAGDTKAVMDRCGLQILIERSWNRREHRFPVRKRRAHVEVRGNAAEPRFHGAERTVAHVDAPLFVAHGEPQPRIPEAGMQPKFSVCVGACNECGPVEQPKPSRLAGQGYPNKVRRSLLAAAYVTGDR